MRDPNAIDAVRMASTGFNANTAPSEIRQRHELIQAVQTLNKSEFTKLADGNRFAVSVDDETRKPVVKVVNPDTKEVLYQIPPQEAVRLAAAARRRAREESTTTETADFMDQVL